ncbi:hypothetical protein GCM10029963_16420 [Micromonospora andamanensis]
MGRRTPNRAGAAGDQRTALLRRGGRLAGEGQAVRLGTPLRGKELQELGSAAPDGPILGVRVADLGVKEALLADDPGLFFTTPHFDGYPSVLVRLDRIDLPELTELIVEAWYARAPKRLATAYQAQTAPPETGG